MGRKLLLAAATLLIAVGCERPEPTYKLKSEKGMDAVVLYDDMGDQPKYVKIKKGEIDKRKAIMERRVLREVSRGIYRKQNRWEN